MKCRVSRRPINSEQLVVQIPQEISHNAASFLALSSLAKREYSGEIIHCRLAAVQYDKADCSTASELVNNP
jgi:hypothetical protein